MPSIWITSKSSPERSDASHFFMCAVESATKRRETADFDRPDPAGDDTSASGSRTERLNLPRHIDQHLVHRPFAEPILRNGRLPARQRAFLAIKSAQPRTLDLNHAAVEADLTFRLTPAVRLTIWSAHVAGTAGGLRIVSHHLR